MEKNNTDNADKNYPWLIDIEEDSVLDGVVALQMEMLGLNPVENNLVTPVFVDFDNSPPASNFSINHLPLSFDSDQTANGFLNLNNPIPHVSQPPSVMLPKVCETLNVPQPAFKKRRLSSNSPKSPSSQDQQLPSKRGRPQKDDDEDNTDPTSLRERKYARTYQQNRKTKLEETTTSLCLICQALVEMEAKFQKYGGITDEMENLFPGTKDIIRKNSN